MMSLDFLIGGWKGNGWRFRVNGPRTGISKTRIVKSESNGSILRLKETERQNKIDQDSPWPTSATVVVYYDDAAKLYRGRMEEEEGTLSGQPIVIMKEQPLLVTLINSQTLQLDMHVATVIVRTTITVTKSGEWHETSQRWNSTDGWTKVQEAVLKRVK